MRNILVLCKSNSATSLMVEALINRQAPGRWCAHSAGSQPATGMNPYTAAVLKEHFQAVNGGRTPDWPALGALQPKSWRDFEGPQAPRFEIVLTVSEDVSWEEMPVWNGVPRLLHWALPDPLAVACTPSERSGVFAAVLGLARVKVDAFLKEEAQAMRLSGEANDNRSSPVRRVGT